MKKGEKKILNFAQNRFLGNRKKFHPLFLQNGWTDQSENFFMSSSAILEWTFFFRRNLVSKKFGSLYKILTSEKKGFLTVTSVFCFS
jgi:hypothetical protein